MKIIIVGCGQVGAALAEQLNEKGNSITVIDTDANNLRTITDNLDIMGVIGNGATYTTLREAGIARADLLIAVTPSDELNLLCCILAKKASNCRAIARVRSHEYSAEAAYLKDELDLAMVINPERAAAGEIARVLRFPSALSIDTFGNGRVELIKFRLPENSNIVGKSIREIMVKDKHDILFCTVERQDEAYIANGDFVFEARDIISIVASPEGAVKFFKKIGYKTDAVRDMVIVGGSEVTHYLCELLKRSSIKIKVIENDPAICDELAASFPKLTVINRDTANHDSLDEEDVGDYGAFLALTDADEENIILSLYARSHTRCKVVTKIKRLDYDDIIQKLDLDTVIYPKNLVANSITRYVRSMKNTLGSNMESLHSIIRGEIDAYEFVVREPSAIVDKPISELKLRRDLIIAAIVRGKDLIFPRGADTIKVGDSVIVVTKISDMRDITDALVPSARAGK